MTQYEKMTTKKVEPLILSLALPTVISMLVTAIYNIADTYFVSKINDSTSAAISVVFSLMTLIQSIGFTIGMGSGAIISKCLGQKKNEEASKYASQGALMAIIFGLIFLIIGLCFNQNVMHLLGASETAKPYAAQYVMWIFIACPFMILSFVMNNILRSEGKAKLSMIGLGLGGIINIADMGISGAGLATMISQMISFSILTSFFIFKKTQSRISYRYLTLDIKSYGSIFIYGAPTLCRQGFATTANIILNFLAKPYGDAVVAALGITAKIYLFVRNIVVGIGQGFQPVLGFNYGAKKYDRIRKAFLFTLLLQTIVSMIATAVVLAFPIELTKFFRDTEEVVNVGKYSVRFLAISLLFLGFSTVVNQALQIMGYARSASFLASCRQGVVYTPVVFIMANLFNTTGLCLTQPLSDLITALISIPYCYYLFRILRQKENELLN